MDKNPTTAEALEPWPAAERVMAVARRGRVSAEAAANAAAEAAEAATATAAAAGSALETMALAEKSAARTAAATRLLVESTRADLADSETDVAMTEVEEAEAHNRYRSASTRAADATEATET